MSKEELSGADIKAMCTEAGLLALRERRMKVSQAEFKKALDYIRYKKNSGGAPRPANRTSAAACRARTTLPRPRPGMTPLGCPVRSAGGPLPLRAASSPPLRALR